MAQARTAEEERLLRAELERLEREIGVLERQWRGKYRLAYFGLLAVPIYFVASGFWAAVTLFMTPALVATQAYLLHVRRKEAYELRGEARAALAALGGGEGRAPGAAAASRRAAGGGPRAHGPSDVDGAPVADAPAADAAASAARAE